MRFVALEEDRSFSVFLTFQDLPIIAGSNVHRTSRIKFNVPDVFRFGIEADRSLVHILGCLGLRNRRFGWRRHCSSLFQTLRTWIVATAECPQPKRPRRVEEGRAPSESLEPYFQV